MTTTLLAQPTRRGRFGRFTLHFFEMCAPMCVGFAIGDLIYLWVAGKFVYFEPFSELPELSVVVVTLTMTAPMVAWMGYRGMARQASAARPLSLGIDRDRARGRVRDRAVLADPERRHRPAGRRRRRPR